MEGREREDELEHTGNTEECEGEGKEDTLRHCHMRSKGSRRQSIGASVLSRDRLPDERLCRVVGSLDRRLVGS